MDTLDDIKRLIETPGFEKLEIGPRISRPGLEEHPGDRAVTLTLNGKQTEAPFRVSEAGIVTRGVLNDASDDSPNKRIPGT